jgi:SAM-dependent methyltransferase
MSDHPGSDPPSPFISDWVRRLAVRGPGRALDVAMGRGRHARLIAAAGFHTFGVDGDFQSVAEAISSGAAAGVTISGWCADLTMHPLPRERFDLIVVVRYLQRDLFPALAGALAPGGMLLYETFTEAQRSRGRGPTSSDHLLKPGELRDRAAGLGVMFYEELLEPDAVARLAARRPVNG